MELLGDVGQIEACIDPFGDSSNLDARYVHSVHRMYHRLQIILDALNGTPR
jgi:hypothetical protein